MKTFVPFKQNFLNWMLLVVVIASGVPMKAQTYTTIANGAWNSASTWQGGNIPVVTNIPAAAVINIKHIVTFSGGNIINNNGTINIQNAGGVSPRLILASGVNVNNNSGAKLFVINAELRQYRFVGGGETGTAQTGKFKNNGGYVEITNSFVEMAGDWSNESSGSVVAKNSSLVIGGNYDLKSSASDNLQSVSLSLGWQGTGDFTISGLGAYYQALRVEVASNSGNFYLKSGTISGDIDYVTLRNHVTSTVSNGNITFDNAVVTTGLNLDAYCAASTANYISNGKCSGTQTLNCSLKYFPAILFGTQSTPKFNMSIAPVLVSGTDLQVNAVYKFESVAPGVDMMVKIDSFKNGATLNKIDDNSGGLGYLEGFQPEIKTGSTAGTSYVVFKLDFKVTGTSTVYPMSTYSVSALDIDGFSGLNEFDQISLGAGATATYMSSPTNISISTIEPGTFRGINISNQERTGIDTSSSANMFTVTNTNVTSVTLKLGVVKSITSQESRQFGIYFKGFNYPGSTLPVKLESFTATLNNSGNKVDLKWTTTSEVNVNHFIVEKSTDGINYSEAGIVFAYGTATDRANYSLSDNIANNQSKVIYYRLRSVDIDSKSQLSETRMIRIGSKSDNAVSILTYPNPVSNELRITIPANWQNKRAVYEIANANGQVTKRTETASSSQTETINVSSLAPGFYIVKVSCEGQTAQQKIIKH